MKPGGDSTAYEPIGKLKPFADGIWIVDDGPLHGIIPLRMTVIRLPNGEMLLHSPTQYSPELAAQIEAIGSVGHLVAPNSVHWMFMAGWQAAHPAATSWAAPGLRRRRAVRKSGLRLDHDLSDEPPPQWGGAIRLVVVPGGFGFREVAVFHQPSRTLVLTDLAMNFEPSRQSLPVRLFCRAAGMHGRAPVYLRALVKLGGAARRQQAARLLALPAERVIFAHGRLVEQDAPAYLRRSLSWLME